MALPEAGFVVDDAALAGAAAGDDRHRAGLTHAMLEGRQYRGPCLLALIVPRGAGEQHRGESRRRHCLCERQNE